MGPADSGDAVTLDLAGADGTASVVRAAATIVSERMGRTDAGEASAVLPRVLADVPAGILLVDQNTDPVTYANDAAARMAPSLSLPASVDRWGRAAGLTGAGGEPLGVSGSPLSMLADGQPVAGAAVRAPAVPPARGADGPSDRCCG